MGNETAKGLDQLTDQFFKSCEF